MCRRRQGSKALRIGASRRWSHSLRNRGTIAGRALCPRGQNQNWDNTRLHRDAVRAQPSAIYRYSHRACGGQSLPPARAGCARQPPRCGVAEIRCSRGSDNRIRRRFPLQEHQPPWQGPPAHRTAVDRSGGHRRCGGHAGNNRASSVHREDRCPRIGTQCRDVRPYANDKAEGDTPEAVAGRAKTVRSIAPRNQSSGPRQR